MIWMSLVKIKKPLALTVIAFVTTTFVVIGNWFSFVNSSFDLYSNVKDTYKQKKAEDNLNVLYTGVSIRYVESIFGPPMIEHHDESRGMHEYIYSFQKFYLQFVYTSNNKVILYTVTVKDKNFHPRIPYLGKELGDTFDNYDDSAEFLFSGYSSKFYEYHEAIYLGNPGNYRNLYLAYNPAGGEYSELKPLPDIANDPKKPPLENDLVIFRKINRPNTFAIGDHLGDQDGIETFYGIGINFYDARDIPTLDY